MKYNKFSFFSDSTKKNGEPIYIFLLLTILILITVDILSCGGGFKTQSILYRGKNNPDNRIEYQIEDIGALDNNN